MPLTVEKRQQRIETYATGPVRLREVVSRTPAEAMKWRPGSDDFSVHEVVVHCADGETNAHMRIRYLTGEKGATIIGYNESHWAKYFDYHSHPLDVALATVDAVRANTAAMIRRLPEAAWKAIGTHTESGPYTAEDWLVIYSDHLEEHIAQIERTLEAWRARR